MVKRRKKKNTNTDYIYGLHPTKKGWQTFVVRKGKITPENAIMVATFPGTVEGAMAMAELLVPPSRLDVEDKQLSKWSPGTGIEHTDEFGSHQGVLLKEKFPGQWLLAVFTSNPRWGKVKVTKEDLAWTKFKPTKPTMWSFVLRPEFEISISLTLGKLPPDRVEELLVEAERKII